MILQITPKRYCTNWITNYTCSLPEFPFKHFAFEMEQPIGNLYMHAVKPWDVDDSPKYLLENFSHPTLVYHRGPRGGTFGISSALVSKRSNISNRSCGRG